MSYYDINGNTPRMKAVCHKGWKEDGANENSLAAFQQAKAKGYKYIECDVRRTSDEVMVLLHETSVNGLTLSQNTYSSIKASYSDLVTFDEFIKWCADNDMHPYIDIKDGSYYWTSLANSVKRYGMQNNVTWLNAGMESFCSGGRYGTLKENYDSYVNYSQYNTKRFVSINASQWTDAQIQILKDAAVPFECYTINTESAIDRVANLGTYGVTTDKVLPSYFPERVYDINGNEI